MEADVGPVGRADQRVVGEQVVQAESRAVALEGGEHVVVKPRRVAQLDRPPDPPRRGVQERVEAPDVAAPAGWELQEVGPEVGAEAVHPIEVVRQPHRRVSQLAPMAAVQADLHGVDEVGRRLRLPVLDRRPQR